MRSNVLRSAVALICASVVLPHAFSVEPNSANKSPTDLRLLNTAIFGKRATEPVVLLEPPQPQKLDPQTVMVDIDDGRHSRNTRRARPPRQLIDDS